MKRIKQLLLFVVLLGVCIGSVMGLRLYLDQPIAQVNAYIRAINKGDYEKAYTLLYKEAKLETRRQEIIDYMADYFGQAQFVKMERTGYEPKITKQEGTVDERIYFDVAYIYTNTTIANGLRVSEQDGRWRVVFPFKLSDVTIDTPIGTTVYINGQPLAKEQSGIYQLNDMLPGNYTVRMCFVEGVKEDYETLLTLPGTTNVISPYETVRVSVEVPKEMIVSLAGEERVSTVERLVYDNVLEGSYLLTVTDPYGHYETYATTIAITEEQCAFRVGNLKFSEAGKQRMQDYIKLFYKNYEQAIQDQDTSFLEQYMASEQVADQKDAFDSWFIKNKNIQDVAMTYAVEGIEKTEEAHYCIEVLEEVLIVNKEKDFNNQTIERHYQLTFKSRLFLEPVGASYVIADKTIDESLVAYQDDAGKWIAY